MKKQFYLVLLFSLFSFDFHAYEIVSETLKVTPGHEVGVLYSIIESGEIPSIPEHNHSNSENRAQKEFDDEDTLSNLIEENFYQDFLKGED